MEREKRQRRQSGILALLAGIPLFVVVIFGWLNFHTPVLAVQDGRIEARNLRAESGPFILTGRWLRFDGALEPGDLEGRPGTEVEDIQYIRKMRGYTYTFCLEIGEGEDWYFLLPRPHGSRLWLDGREVAGEEGGLSAGEIYRIADYTEQTRIEVVLQVTNSSIYDVYQGMILGNQAELREIQNRWMILDMIAVGLCGMLILMCLALYLPKRSEGYLLLLAASTLAELAHFLLIPRHPAMSFFHLGSTVFYRQLGFINYYVCRQLVPGTAMPWMNRAVPAAAAMTALGCLFWPEYSNRWIQTSYFFYMALQAWILGTGVLKKMPEAPVILTGCMLAFGNELFYLLLYGGFIPQGVVDIEIMPAQYMRFAYIVAFALATCMKYGKKFREADLLSVNLERQVRRQTDELRRANEELMRIQDNRQRFMTDMVHNLRSPLFAIEGYLDLLRDALPQPTKEQKRYLDTLDRKAEYIGKITDDMFLIYRLEDGRLKLEKTVFDICELLRTVGEDAEAEGKAKELCVEVETETDPCYLEGDRFRLKQVFDNILDNAVRYSPQNGRIRIDQRTEENRCTVTVQDQGPGIREEQKKRLFVRYESKGDGGKTGLGLSICHSLLELHGGSLEAEDAPGGGTLMRIELPLFSEEIKAGEQETM